MATQANKSKRSSKAPANESPDQRFVRIANERMPKTLKMIQRLALIGGRYKSTPEQRKKMIDALRAKVDSVEKQLAGTVDAAPEFKL